MTQVREVKAGSSYLSQNDTRVHFGLGTTAAIDRLEVRWPSGRVDVVQRPPVDAAITVVEGEGVTARTPFVAQDRPRSTRGSRCGYFLGSAVRLSP